MYSLRFFVLQKLILLAERIDATGSHQEMA